MSASDAILFSLIVHRIQVFNLRIALKDLSQSQLVTGKVDSILSKVNMLGNLSSSHCFRGVAHEPGSSSSPAYLILHRRNSAGKSCGDGRSSLYISTTPCNSCDFFWFSFITEGPKVSSLETWTVTASKRSPTELQNDMVKKWSSHADPIIILCSWSSNVGAMTLSASNSGSGWCHSQLSCHCHYFLMPIRIIIHQQILYFE